MKYGVISDIHSNREALRIVLEHLLNRGAQRFLCVGDVVGYGPHPNEAVETMRRLPGLVAVAGNHDKAAIGGKDLTWFNPHARAAALWTQNRLSADSRAFLKSLPDRAEGANATLVHGTPRDPIDEYFLDRNQFQENESLFSTPLCFVGHSHLPFVIGRNAKGFQMGALENGRTVSLKTFSKAVVNPGSVGQPRDGDPRASCALYDDAFQQVTLFRLEYDIASVQEEMKEAGLPRFLWERLSKGQ